MAVDCSATTSACRDQTIAVAGGVQACDGENNACMGATFTGGGTVSCTGANNACMNAIFQDGPWTVNCQGTANACLSATFSGGGSITCSGPTNSCMSSRFNAASSWTAVCSGNTNACRTATMICTSGGTCSKTCSGGCGTSSAACTGAIYQPSESAWLEEEGTCNSVTPDNSSDSSENVLSFLSVALMLLMIGGQ